jgi:hypothetical protein
METGVEYRKVPIINAFVRWLGYWLSVLRLVVCGCAVCGTKSDPIMTWLGSTW